MQESCFFLLYNIAMQLVIMSKQSAIEWNMAHNTTQLKHVVHAHGVQYFANDFDSYFWLLLPFALFASITYLQSLAFSSPLT